MGVAGVRVASVSVAGVGVLLVVAAVAVLLLVVAAVAVLLRMWIRERHLKQRGDEPIRVVCIVRGPLASIDRPIVPKLPTRRRRAHRRAVTVLHGSFMATHELLRQLLPLLTQLLLRLGLFPLQSARVLSLQLVHCSVRPALLDCMPCDHV